MKMILVRIGVRQPGEGYPLELSVDGGEDPSGPSPAPATATLHDDLGAGDLGDRGVADRDGVVGALRESTLGPDRAGVSERVGEHPYRLLAQGDVKDRWDEVAAENARFALEVGNCQLLAWELVRRNAGYVFADETRPWFRADPSARIDRAPPPPATSAWSPLRILIVVGSEETDDQLGAEEEIRGIVRAIDGARAASHSEALVDILDGSNDH